MKLPRALNAPLFSGRIRSVPEDFVVEELHAFEATGEGEHLLLSIRKRGMNTAFCAQNIARWAGIDERDVSYAGMKDRHAVTTQRFSVRLPKKTAPDVALLNNEECQVLEAVWHNRKLARGALAGNRFSPALATRVRLFQREHALEDDAVVGLQTLLKLNEALDIDPTATAARALLAPGGDG